jgi:methylated-DNA-protein-cysteine methyltransferase-like protein
MGEYTVDLQRFGWFPSVLPSEAAEGESSDEEQSEAEDEDKDAAAYHT